MLSKVDAYRKKVNNESESKALFPIKANNSLESRKKDFDSDEFVDLNKFVEYIDLVFNFQAFLSPDYNAQIPKVSCLKAGVLRSKIANFGCFGINELFQMLENS